MNLKPSFTISPELGLFGCATLVIIGIILFLASKSPSTRLIGGFMVFVFSLSLGIWYPELLRALQGGNSVH